MAAIVTFDYQAIGNASKAIRETHATAYTAAASAFKTGMEAAIAGWTGESKLKMQALLEASIYPDLETSVPAIVTSLADLLDDNGTAMAQTDKAIADQIPSGTA